MDFLGLRNLTILDDALVNIEGQPRRRHRPRRAVEGPDRPGDLRPARPRRHPRGVPVRRRPDALAAAADAAGQLRGHLGRRRALPPGPDGRRLATRTTRCARTGSRRSPRSTPSSRSRSRRSWATTYGLIVYQEQVMAIAQKLAGYTLGKADLLRRAMGKKKREVLDAEFVGFSEGMLGARLLRRRRSRRCGTSSSRSPTTRSTRRTPRPTAWSPTGRPTSRPTTRPSTWPRCSPACATTRTSRRSTSTSAGGWASRCCRPTSTSPTPTSPRSAPTSASG